MLFSHEAIRPSQQELIDTIAEALQNKKSVLAHAPTGLGKTAAALCPALEVASKKKLTVFFLTSRHTQHRIVLETVRKLNEKHGTKFSCASMIGKRWMCAQDVENLPSADFTEYCKGLVENNECEFYSNARGKHKVVAKKVLADLKADGPLGAEAVMAKSTTERVCPYEMSLMLAEEADVIVADYYYIFHPNIRDTLFAKIKKNLNECIVIVDEGHNVPSRLRDLLTYRLTNRMMRLAIQEAKKHSLDIMSELVEVQDVLNRLGAGLKEGGEKLVRVHQFVNELKKIKPVDELTAEFELAADVVREEQKRSHIASVASFLREWQREGDGFARIISRQGMMVTLSNRCLDPALLTRPVVEDCYSMVVMSGTLSPPSMYADMLGMENVVAKSFESPFPERNRLPVIVPRTTTKYSLRSERQFQNIGRVCGDLARSIPGCVMIFFPSYAVRDAVRPYFTEEYELPVFVEKPRMSNADKQSLVTRFSSHKSSGAAFLGVAAGSFGEGVDLPGVLKGVIVVGLPLEKPDLETTELIEYYDRKFGKGWEYGYVLPAMTKCIQNAGRCIRSEKDRGVLAFVDERYVWPRYKSCFPPEWELRVLPDFQSEIAQFFGRLG